MFIFCAVIKSTSEVNMQYGVAKINMCGAESKKLILPPADTQETSTKADCKRELH